MHFAVSGVEVFPLLPVAVAFVLAFFCSMGGISGAFLLLPFQMSFLGYTAPSVSPTNHLYNVISTPSGVWRFLKERRMVWPLALVVAAGSVPGTLAGTVLRVLWLPDPEIFKIFAAAVLLTISICLVLEQIHARRSPAVEPPSDFAVVTREFSSRRIAYDFQGATHSVSAPGLFCLCFGVGVAGGAYGIGGGAIIAPILVSVFRLPVHTLAGSTLLGNFLTSLSALFFFLVLDQFHPGTAPDWPLGLLFGLGGFLGIYCGARVQRHVPAALLSFLLLLILLGTSLRYAVEALRP
ncbi:MAG: sulfite exporter TauE/SafE family protein [Desulfovibrio sp.]|nr:sulfite exporter TauE/SafE family protein [Desulfovibrio sp.]